MAGWGLISCKHLEANGLTRRKDFAAMRGTRPEARPQYYER